MDNELQIIIDKAFIYESCPQKRVHTAWRKEQLTKRLLSYIDKKLSEDKSGNGLEQGTDRRELVPTVRNGNS